MLAAVDRIAPFRLAEPWDNVGLQVGSRGASVARVLVGLEVTRAFLDEAFRLRADTLVTHHPLLFRERKTWEESDPVSRFAAELVRRGMALIVAHTNLDSTADGTNGELADRLGLAAEGRRFLRPIANQAELTKFAVFTPLSHIDAVIAAIAEGGGGAIGNYSHCTFRTPGTGTFKPLAGANPFIGEVGAIEQVEEVRIEAVCAMGNVRRMLESVKAAHPYEEMAFDLLPMSPDPRPKYGLGLVGRFAEPTTLEALAERARRALPSGRVEIVGEPSAALRSASLCTGAGGEFVRTGRTEADVFITGEMNHHDAWEARHRGINVLLVGHAESEAIIAPRLAARLGAELAAGRFDVAVAAEGG